MYYIVKYTNGKNGININGAMLVNEDESFKMEFIHLTEKGYQSSKPLIVDFAYTEAEGELQVGDDVAKALIQKYSNVQPRVFETKQQQNENSLQSASNLLNGINPRWGDKRPY